jgi:eukaryotic-like serine/threonine-protein kinase
MACLSDEELRQYVDHKLDKKTHALLQAHVEDCESCRQRMAEQAHTQPRTPPPLATPATPAQRRRRPRRTRAPGTTVSRYAISKLVGEGGMGIVYVARDPELKRDVALKLLGAAEGSDAEVHRTRLLREAQAMAQIAHPNVVAVYDAGTWEGEVFIAMELATGGTLREWMKQQHSSSEIIATFVSAGRGLGAAHAAGIVHRDFKPDNVLIGADGRVRVTDFGLAQSQAHVPLPLSAAPQVDPSMNVVVSSSLAGTPAYMAPELFDGKVADAASDQFAFCVAMWEALYKRRPHVGNDETARVEAVKIGKIADPPRGHGVPRRVELALRRGLAPDPNRRWPAMDALLDTMAPKPRRAMWSAAALVVAGAVVGGAWLHSRTTGDPCRGTDTLLAGVWNAAKHTAIDAAFAATKVPYASEASSTTASRLDDYAARWSTMRKEACVATHVRHEQSEDVLVLRASCLDRRELELEALITRLSEADAAFVEKSVQAVEALPDLTACADVAALQQSVKPPSGPGVAAKLDALEREIADSKTRLQSGKFRDTLPIAQQAVTQAKALGDAQLQAEALIVLAGIHENIGEAKAAHTELIDAFSAAERAKADRVRAEAAVKLVWVTGGLESQFDTAKSWEDIAGALLDRIGGDTDLQLRLVHNHANLLFAEGKVNEFLAAQQQSVALHEQLAKPNDIETLLAIANLGVAYDLHGDYPDALSQWRTARAAMAKQMGATYVHVGIDYNNEAEVLIEQGHASDAVPLAEEAVKILLATRGPTHPETITAQKNYAAALLYSGDVRRATAYVEDRAASWMAVAEHDDSLAADVADVRASIDRTNGNPEQAIAVLQPLIAARAADDSQLAVLLTRLGQCQLDLKHPKDAIVSFERAVKVGTEHSPLPSKLATAKFELARVLVSTGGDAARARTLATEALAVFTHAEMTRATEAKAWLDALPK